MKQLSQKLKRLMNQQWEEIGPDSLTSMEQIENTKNPLISRDDAIELILDANRLETHLKMCPDPEIEKELKEFRELTWRQQIAVARIAFPYETYLWMVKWN